MINFNELETPNLKKRNLKGELKHDFLYTSFLLFLVA